jgi:hypothetical protein
MTELDQLAKGRRMRQHPAIIPGVLVLMFFGPLVVAWALYFTAAEEWRTAPTGANGELVMPVRPLEGLVLQPLVGAAQDADLLRGRWSLVYVTDSACGQDCQERLYYLRQIRIALHRDMERLQRLVVITDTARWSEFDQVLAEYPGTIVATAPPAELERHLLGSTEGGAGMAESFYVVDPLGNLVLRYGPDADASGVLKDLQRLLRNSRIG